MDKNNNKPARKTAEDWARIEKEIDEELKRDEAKVDGGDRGIEEVLRGIYSSGDDEMRRAMMKSLVESGGTVLSTNWKDVAKHNYTEEREKYLGKEAKK